MAEASPVKKKERETFMDVLRGFAILGIFLANLHSFSWWEWVPAGTEGPLLVPVLDQRVEFFRHFLVEGKFYSIFSLLFGWGMAIQLARLQAQGIQSVFIIRKRLAIMLLLGAVHLLLWPGDIVFFYGLLGFLLLMCRNFSPKRMLWLGMVLVLSPILLYWLKMKFPALNFPVDKLSQAGEWADRHITQIGSAEGFQSYLKKADWIDVLKADIPGFFFRYTDLFFQSRISKVLGMMIIGMAIGKSNFYQHWNRNRKTVVFILIGGLLVGLPANYILAVYMKNDGGSYYGLTVKGWNQTVAYAVGVAPLALAYVAAFMLLFQRSIARRFMNCLAPVGRMAFSNYIFQTLVGNFVFLNAGLGFMTKVGPMYYSLFGLVVFILQVIISTAWLKRFNYGPIEWLWRSATYGKWQPMRQIEL